MQRLLNSAKVYRIDVDYTREELVTAIEEVLQWRSYLTPAVTKDVLAKLSEVPAKAAALTKRQREVLQLVVKGHRMKEIGALLGLSTRTVETHKYEMMHTLGVQTTAELVRYAALKSPGPRLGKSGRRAKQEVARPSSRYGIPGPHRRRACRSMLGLIDPR